MPDVYVVGRADEIPERGRLLVQVGGRSIGIFRENGRYYALLNRCPHQGAELCRGDLVGVLESSSPGEFRFDPDRRLLVCPWHGWEFDLATGRSYVDPTRTRVRPYTVEQQTGQTVAAALEAGVAAVAGQAAQPGLVEGPYRAETFEISVVDDYLMLSLAARPAPKTVGRT
jgi:nitrite reductase/ring-hydroxylating ferredoxin subunit